MGRAWWRGPALAGLLSFCAAIALRCCMGMLPGPAPAADLNTTSTGATDTLLPIVPVCSITGPGDALQGLPARQRLDRWHACLLRRLACDQGLCPPGSTAPPELPAAPLLRDLEALGGEEAWRPTDAEVALAVVGGDTKLTLIWTAIKAAARHERWQLVGLLAVLGQAAASLALASADAHTRGSGESYLRAFHQQRILGLYERQLFRQCYEEALLALQRVDAIHRAPTAAEHVVSMASLSALRMKVQDGDEERVFRQLGTLRRQHPAILAIAFNFGMLHATHNRWAAGSEMLTAAILLGVDPPQSCSSLKPLDWARFSFQNAVQVVSLEATTLAANPDPHQSYAAGTAHPLALMTAPGARHCASLGSACSVLPLPTAELELFGVVVHNATLQTRRIVCGCHLLLPARSQLNVLHTTTPAVRVDRLEAIIFTHFLPGAYYHFTGEVLPKLLWLKASGALARPPWDKAVMILDDTSFVRELLNLIAFPLSRVRWRNLAINLEVEHLWILDYRHSLAMQKPPAGRISPPPRFLMEQLRQTVFKRVRRAESQDLVVFAFRKPTAGQRALRGDVTLLLDMLRNVTLLLGGGRLEFYVHADFRDTQPPPIADQISTFSRAKVLIGPHSAGLANAIWMERGTAVIEFPLHPLQVTIPASLCAALGIDYWVVPEVTSTQHGHYEVGELAARAAGQALAAALRKLGFGPTTRTRPTVQQVQG